MESADATIAVMDQVLADHASAKRPADEDRPRRGYALDDGVELICPPLAVVIERRIERLPRLAMAAQVVRDKAMSVGEPARELREERQMRLGEPVNENDRPTVRVAPLPDRDIDAVGCLDPLLPAGGPAARSFARILLQVRHSAFPRMSRAEDSKIER